MLSPKMLSARKDSTKGITLHAPLLTGDAATKINHVPFSDRARPRSGGRERMESSEGMEAGLIGSDGVSKMQVILDKHRPVSQKTGRRTGIWQQFNTMNGSSTLPASNGLIPHVEQFGTQGFKALTSEKMSDARPIETGRRTVTGTASSDVVVKRPAVTDRNLFAARGRRVFTPVKGPRAFHRWGPGGGAER